jgi:hypothetical protein
MTRLLARPRLTAFALFTLLSVAHTWPLATAPGRLSRNDNADTALNEWIVAWIAHQAPSDPRHLFDANIFFPDRNTLAYSEYLLVPAAMGAPALWLGASPVLVYNLLVLAGLTLTGWAGCLLMWRWTGDLPAGLVSGVLLAFNAHTLTRLPQLQAFHLEFLPLALLAFDALLTTPRLRHALWLALWFVLQGLTSFYTMIFTTTALLVGGLARPEDWWGARARRLLPLVGLAAGLALVVMLPFLLPYTRLGQVRPLVEVAYYSAAWRDYLATPARVHYDLWSRHFWGNGSAMFPGVTSLALAAVALASGVGVTDRRARMALAFGMAGVALSFGPSMPGYALLYHLLPPLQGIRNAARFGYLAILACAILSGFAVAAIRARWRGAWWTPAFVALVLIGANLDAFSAPITYVDADPVSPLHARLRHTDAIVAEFPFFAPNRVFHNARYMLESTAHWRPMINGYSGLVPDSYKRWARELARFPDDAAMAALRAAGVTHVFVHNRAMRAWTGEKRADAVRHAPGLGLLAVDGDLSLYELRLR